MYIVLYILLLLALSWWTSRRAGNDAFYRGERKSPWYLVAFGMIGASISGVSFVSVPGMVLRQDMTYLQTCLGFIFGYIAVAFILLPVYYRHNLTTIYSYLEQRLGHSSYLTGAWFFLLSKMAGASIRFYVVCILLQRYVMDDYGIPFWVTVVMTVLMIWLYTRRSGIKTLVWTDTLQTACMFLALAFIIVAVIGQLQMPVAQAWHEVWQDSHSRIFVFDDWTSKQYFWKQFVSGIFIVIVMTGLDQDMMQKNLTCRNLRDAQKDMTTYGMAFVPANLMFLVLGVLLFMLANKQGVALPQQTDHLLPMFAATGRLGETVLALFTIGIVASSFSSADSALTSLTTSYCVDICGRKDDEKLRRKAHIVITMIFIACILVVDAVGNDNVLDTIYTLCGYTYGPLLGLFAFAMLPIKHSEKLSHTWLVPAVCIIAPATCYALDTLTSHYGYHMGYELLMLNGLITFTGLYFVRFINPSNHSNYSILSNHSTPSNPSNSSNPSNP